MQSPMDREWPLVRKDQKKIAVINYGAGNLGSVVNALTRLGYQPLVTDSVFEVLKADAVFLPGVGAAGDTMKGLEAIGMADAVKETGGLEKAPLRHLRRAAGPSVQHRGRGPLSNAWTSYPVRSRNCPPD